VAIAVANYLRGIPTAGNDLVLVVVLALVGLLIGVASGQAVIMRRDADGEVLARSGWVSGFFWVLTATRTTAAIDEEREPRTPAASGRWERAMYVLIRATVHASSPVIECVALKCPTVAAVSYRLIPNYPSPGTITAASVARRRRSDRRGPTS
jgi:hypothetical protein